MVTAKFLIDTDWIVFYLRGREPYVSTLKRLQKEGLAVSVISVAELYEEWLFVEIAEIKEKALPVLRRYGVERAAVFGSHAKEEAKESSDVDFLIRYAPGARRSLLTHVRLVNDLREAVGKDVDVVTEEFLSRLLRDEVLRTAKRIL
uniref:Polymerase nucleotidyl transferase domain-containing protein n=1 Tax=Ammonifex degensii TaxID=42838 RepID=A0A7C2IWE4_9THEO